VVRQRLVKAGADVIVRDFTDLGALMGFMGYGDARFFEKKLCKKL
jgi:hypothetical protein